MSKVFFGLAALLVSSVSFADTPEIIECTVTSPVDDFSKEVMLSKFETLQVVKVGSRAHVELSLINHVTVAIQIETKDSNVVTTSPFVNESSNIRLAFSLSNDVGDEVIISCQTHYPDPPAPPAPPKL